MATARQDYVRFLRWLHALQPAVSDQVRQFANMVFEDFDAVAETAAQRNARSTHLAALARRTLTATPTAMPAGQDEEEVAAWPWTRLRSLSVGPFRGFVREETFDLQRRVILFYGPNGSGKSSICEAFERALLGVVEEAGLKRLDEANYLSNIHAGQFVEPRLIATGADRRELVVQPNADLYRFCFIEKNRIDAFSRLAQRPQGQRVELIATLFGMEKFNDFCNRFNDQIDAALVIDPLKQRELRLKQEGLERDRATVAAEAQKLEFHDAEDARYAQAYRPEVTFVQLQDIIGTAETPGRLAELNGLLNAVPASLIGADRPSLEAAFDRTKLAADALAATGRALQQRASQVSFRALYGAVLALEAEHRDHCPACETPLDRTTVNPFEKARAGLEDLRELAQMQEREAQQQRDLLAELTELHTLLTRLSGFVSAQGEVGSDVGQHLAAMPVQVDAGEWWRAFYVRRPDVADDPGSIEQTLGVADRIFAIDEITRVQHRQRAALAAERDDLFDRQRHIDQRRLVRQRIIDDASAARANIAAFDLANAPLISAAVAEREEIARDAPIRGAYNTFLTLLRRFRQDLPGMLIAGLGDLSRDLYNEFNRGDREEDKLAQLYLPLTGNQRIELAFRGAPNRRVDALQVLSEGHIRCLGLAVLLAKATNVGSPLLIFDDAVNAIDHDHRNGIKETIFVGDRFVTTQVLVTCHSPEFIKDIRNSIPNERRNDCKEYGLTHHEGDHHPRVHRDVPSSAYIDKARLDLERFQLRDALGNSRRALEMLSNKAWKWLASYGLGEVRLTMHGPTAPANLRDVCDALRVKVRDSAAFVHPSKDPLRQALDEILATSNLTWRYLNGGTHEEEDRDEFDRVEVELVVSRLERIDAMDLRPRR